MLRYLFFVASFAYASAVFCTSPANLPYKNISHINAVYIAAQLPLDPHTNKIIVGNMETLTTRVMENLESALAAAGYSLYDVIKTEVYLTDMRDFKVMDHVYSQFFIGMSLPPRDIIGVSELLYGATIQIACVATH